MTLKTELPRIVPSNNVSLVGADDAVAVSQYTNSANLVFGRQLSGEIVSMCLYAAESGTGETQEVAGEVLFLSADPAVAAGDTDLAAGEWPTVVGTVAVAATDWVSGVTGSMAFVPCAVPFELLGTLYAVMKMDAASAINSAGGDDETLTIQVRARLG